MIHGTTDAAGQTIEVLVPKGITEKDIQLVPVVGEGNFGKNFVLRYKGDALAVLGVQYRISMGRRVVAEGYSDEHGNTKYVQSKRPRKLVLEVRDGQCPNSPDSED